MVGRAYSYHQVLFSSILFLVHQKEIFRLGNFLTNMTTVSQKSPVESDARADSLIETWL